jgi:hypothetical protein
MAFDNFSLSRDMLYLSGAFTGMGLGVILTLFRKDIGTRSRNRRIALILVLFSIMLAGFSIAIIASRGAIFRDSGVLVIAGLFIPLGALAVYFPRTVAYPLFLLSGLAAVWLGYTCLRFPPLSKAPVALISSAASGSFSIRLFPGNAKTGSVKAEEDDISVSIVETGKTFYTKSGASLLYISVITAEISRLFPFIGGSSRAAIFRVSADADPLFADKSLEESYRRADSAAVPGISHRNLSGTVHLENAAPGMDIPVYVSELTPAKDRIP